MAKIRTVKPEVFRHEILYQLEQKTKLPIRICWIGLFTVADREGRFSWRPNVLKLDIAPWDQIDFEKVLKALESESLIRKYAVNGQEYGYIPTWKKHQVINVREAQSRLPAPLDSHVHACAIPCNAHGELEVEKEGNKEVEREMEGASHAPSPTWLAAAWNSNCGDLPKVRDPDALNEKRRKAAKARLAEYEPEFLTDAIQRMAASSFCLGKRNRPGAFQNWQADFDFFLQPGRIDQALEGKFDDRSVSSESTPTDLYALIPEKGGAA